MLPEACQERRVLQLWGKVGVVLTLGICDSRPSLANATPAALPAILQDPTDSRVAVFQIWCTRERTSAERIDTNTMRAPGVRSATGSATTARTTMDVKSLALVPQPP